MKKKGETKPQQLDIEQPENKQGQSSILSGKKNKTNLLRGLAASKNDRCSHKFRGYWRSLDMFGERVEFTFKGQRAY